jgi:ankyrin repeat protein
LTTVIPLALPIQVWSDDLLTLNKGNAMTAIRLLYIALISLIVVAAHAEDTATKSASIPQQEVIEAALYGKIETIEKALEAGYEVNARDPENRTALMYAAFNGQTAIVQKLIDAGADVNAQDKTGSTALMFAASGPYAETVQLLLEAGAQINMVDNNEHWSALMWAAAEGQAEAVKLLLENKADTTLKDVDGDTAESFAAEKGHTAVVQILKAATPKQSTDSTKEGEPE